MYRIINRIELFFTLRFHLFDLNSYEFVHLRRENVSKKTEIRRVIDSTKRMKEDGMQAKFREMLCIVSDFTEMRTVQPCQRNMKYHDEIWAKLTIPAFEIRQDSFETTTSIRDNAVEKNTFYLLVCFSRNLV